MSTKEIFRLAEQFEKKAGKADTLREKAEHVKKLCNAVLVKFNQVEESRGALERVVTTVADLTYGMTSDTFDDIRDTLENLLKKME